MRKQQPVKPIIFTLFESIVASSSAHSCTIAIDFCPSSSSPLLKRCYLLCTVYIVGTVPAEIERAHTAREWNNSEMLRLLFVSSCWFLPRHRLCDSLPVCGRRRNDSMLFCGVNNVAHCVHNGFCLLFMRKWMKMNEAICPNVFV